MLNFFKLLHSCDHTQAPLQRRPLSQPDFKLGLPGIGPIISVGSPTQARYLYYCPTCKNNLPPAENARWESLYTRAHRSARPPARSKPRPQPASPQSRYKREPIGAKLRYDILQRDNNRCKKCGATGQQVRLHVDHIIPVSQGGGNNPSNLQTLCERCNLGKGARRG